MSERLRALSQTQKAENKMIGLNLRMQELTAVLLMAQIEDAKKIVASRRAIAITLSTADTQNGLQFPQERRHCRSSWYCTGMLAPDQKTRDRMTKALQAEGVPARAGYVFLPEISDFKQCIADASNAKDYHDRLVLLELCTID